MRAVLVLPGGTLPSNPHKIVFDFSSASEGEASEETIEAFCEWLGVSPMLVAHLFHARTLLGTGPRDTGFVHDLPPAPRFVGRSDELTRLFEMWNQPGSGVMGVIGMGGSGKTALVSEFIGELTAEGLEPIDGLFVWSFYEDPDPNAFLEAAYEYVTDVPRPDVKGAGWLHLLKDALTRDDERILLVLDGLERVQRQRRLREDDPRVFGELEDKLLAGFLKRMAGGPGSCKILITTRFPVSDLQELEGYHMLDLGGLDLSAGISLLRYHQVKGTDTELADLIGDAGSHALTLDHLGALLQRYFEGNPRHFPELGPLVDCADAPGQRLRSIFSAYEQHLPPLELKVLTHLCIFRFGIPLKTFNHVFMQSNVIGEGKPFSGTTVADVEEALQGLVEQHLVLLERRDHFTVHPAVRDHFYHLFTSPEDMHRQVSDYFRNLTGRPGSELPNDKSTLDHLEELVYHLLQAGLADQAVKIYRERLGGVWHLTRIGEFARGHRILLEFPEPIDFDGMLRYRRGIGDLPSPAEWEALEEQRKLTFFSANGLDSARLLRGELKPCRCPTARFLRGWDVKPLFSDDYAPRFSAILLAHDIADFFEWRNESHYEDTEGNRWQWDELWKHIEALTLEGVIDDWVQQYRHRHPSTSPLQDLHHIPAGPIHSWPDTLRVELQHIWLDYHFVLKHQRSPKPRPGLSPAPHNRAVTHLWIAEKHREQGNFAGAQSHVEQASSWILHASSQEHLCLLHLTRARIGIDLMEWDDVRSALEEGFHIAEHARFGLYQIDLLNAKARFLLRISETGSARAAADQALALASEEHCRYRHGAAVASELLAEMVECSE